MSGAILGLLIALCGDDKSCFSQALILEPKTAKQAALDVRTIQARKAELNRDQCGPTWPCYSGYAREDKAEFLFSCELRGKSKDCWRAWIDSKENKKLEAEWEKVQKK